jgi:hypothetical protein
MRITKSCERAGHVEKPDATVHTGGVLRSICARCGVPVALKIGGWKAIAQQPASADGAAFSNDRRRGKRGTVFDRAIGS